ncbi:MAG: hypothetical protein ACRDUB_19065, partial [Mycobacterium sp.]
PVTLPYVNTHSSGERGGGVRVGGGGAFQPQFTHHMYLPMPTDGAPLDSDAPVDAPPPPVEFLPPPPADVPAPVTADFVQPAPQDMPPPMPVDFAPPAPADLPPAPADLPAPDTIPV